MEDWEAFCEFLCNRQAPRSLSESTADDAIEFLLTLPSHRMNKAAGFLSATTFKEIDGNRKQNPFGGPIVRNFLKEQEYGVDAALEEVETPPQLNLPEHSITGFEPVLLISCGDNQDSEETYFISYIFNELCLRGFAPLRYDITRSLVDGCPEMLYRSRVCIIVFSMNYARSVDCLDGFVATMDYLKANNLLLIPVFFKVSLEDVSGQSCYFEIAFSRLEHSVQASQVLKWRAAMIKLTSINRYHYIKGDQVMLVKNIFKDVCFLLSSETNGIKHPLENILSLLNCSQSSSPHIVGLWGMAGIGKTTITRDIFRTQAGNYDVCYFLPDFHRMCQTKGLSHLRDEFLSKIFGEEKVFADVSDTKLSFKRDRLLDKRVLIVLDGVSNARDAEFLLGGFGWFSGGHTIILTSRNRQVLVQCNVKEVYQIPKLSDFESLCVCCYFSTEENWERSMSSISELVNYASGIPLALGVLGSSVLNQCVSNEDEHLRRLRKHPPIEIQDAFKRSFNGLDDNEKNIILDIACFFRGEDKDHVVNILDGCSFLTDLGIYGLIDESLISLVDNMIDMPNIFQDMGRFVVCQENNDAGKRSRLCDLNDIVDVLTNNSGKEEIEGIFLDVSDLAFELTPTVFERMYRLRLLKLHCPTSNHGKVCLPQGLNSLPDELRLLHWERYPLGSLPRNFNPENLVELNMPYSNLTKLWKGKKNLEKLKRIILSHSRQLTKFPRLSKAVNLEHIDLEGCTSLVKVNSSILHHHKLTFLSLKDCSHLRVMPTTVHLKSLEVLNLSGCSDLEDLHDFSTNLKELYLAGTAIREMPSSIEELTRLVTLDLENCKRLQHLPLSISNLKAAFTFSTKRPASSMDTRDLSSLEDTTSPYKRCRLKRVIESVILRLRKRKRGKRVSRATSLSEVQFDSASTLVNDLSYKSFWGYHVLPERPSQPECQVYMKTGDCKFGHVCIFHHPRNKETHVPEKTSSMASKTPDLNPLGLSLSLGSSSTSEKFRIHKNISSMVSETPHSNPLRLLPLLGTSSCVSDITQATVGRDTNDSKEGEENSEIYDW